MEETMEKVSLSFKVDPRLKAALERLAAKENRSLANYTVTVLMSHLEAEGIAWQEVPASEEKPAGRSRSRKK